MKWISLIVVVIFSVNAFGRAGRPAQERNASWFSNRVDRLSQDDLTTLRNRYRAESCYQRNGVQVSCGERSEWDQGDPTFTWDPFFNQIPRGTQAEVEINCNPSTRRFEMNIKVGTNPPKYLHYPDPNNPSAFLSNQPTRWTTSPGLYPESSTNLPVNQPFVSDRAVVTEYHRVSDAQEWSGAPMFHAVWVRGGIAVHGSDDVDGIGRSGGCIRLSQQNARVFFLLARRIGTRNIRYNWGGYGPGNPPACATPANVRQQVLAARAASTRAQRDQYIAELDESIRGQMAAEGRVQGETNPEDGQRAVQSFDEPQKREPQSETGAFQKIKQFFKNLF